MVLAEFEVLVVTELESKSGGAVADFGESPVVDVLTPLLLDQRLRGTSLCPVRSLFYNNP